jgi:sugar lactone lactonase YvrE
MSADGIAISSDGSRLYYCPLASRKLYSNDTEMLIDESADKDKVASAVTDEGDKGWASDGLESDADGCIYSTNYEHNAILRRRPNGRWETVVHDPRLLWPDTYISFIGDRSISEKDFGIIQRDRDAEMIYWSYKVKEVQKNEKD